MPICRRLPPAAARRTPKLGPRSCRTRGASPRAAAVVASRGSGRRTAALRATRPCCTNDPGAQDAMAGLEGLADHYDLVIVGAGLSGAVFAEQAASRYGLSSLIIDKRDHIGACATAPPAPWPLRRHSDGGACRPALACGCACGARTPEGPHRSARHDANPATQPCGAAAARPAADAPHSRAQAATASTSSTSTASA